MMAMPRMRQPSFTTAGPPSISGTQPWGSPQTDAGTERDDETTGLALGRIGLGRGRSFCDPRKQVLNIGLGGGQVLDALSPVDRMKFRPDEPATFADAGNAFAANPAKR